VNEPAASGTRSSGTMRLAASFGLSDHACWGYTSDADRAAAASQWLTVGLAMGQRALYVGDGPQDVLRAELASVPGGLAAFERGALYVLSTDEAYDVRAPLDPETQLARFDTEVQRAIGDGYRGLRATADITPIVRDADRRPAHLSWEQAVDRYMTAHPYSGLCLYDRRSVGDLDAIRCAHPLQGPDDAEFAVFAIDPTTVVVEGEVDAGAAGLLGRLLDELPATDERVDLRGLSFIDGRAGAVLAGVLDERRAAGRPLAVVGTSSVLRRVWDVCEFDASLLAGA